MWSIGGTTLSSPMSVEKTKRELPPRKAKQNISYTITKEENESDEGDDSYAEDQSTCEGDETESSIEDGDNRSNKNTWEQSKRQKTFFLEQD